MNPPITIVPSSRPPEQCNGRHWWSAKGTCVQCGTPQPDIYAEVAKRLWPQP